MLISEYSTTSQCIGPFRLEQYSHDVLLRGFEKSRWGQTRMSIRKLSYIWVFFAIYGFKLMLSLLTVVYKSSVIPVVYSMKLPPVPWSTSGGSAIRVTKRRIHPHRSSKQVAVSSSGEEVITHPWSKEEKEAVSVSETRAPGRCSEQCESWQAKFPYAFSLPEDQFQPSSLAWRWAQCCVSTWDQPSALPQHQGWSLKIGVHSWYKTKRHRPSVNDHSLKHGWW